jgi:hypothetical protein
MWHHLVPSVSAPFSSLGMTLCTSESKLISLYIKYLYGLHVHWGHIDTILMGTISAQKKQSS